MEEPGWCSLAQVKIIVWKQLLMINRWYLIRFHLQGDLNYIQPKIHTISFFLIRTLEPHIRFSGDLNIKTGLGYLYLGTVTLYGHVDMPL